MMKIAKAAFNNRYICTVDITGAYLTADMGSVKVHKRLDNMIPYDRSTYVIESF
jgi:hypothetical protein